MLAQPLSGLAVSVLGLLTKGEQRLVATGLGAVAAIWMTSSGLRYGALTWAGAVANVQ